MTGVCRLSIDFSGFSASPTKKYLKYTSYTLFMIRKNITITEEQAAFVKERNINLSRLVQNVLDKDREDWKFHLSTQEAFREIERGQYKDQNWNDLLKEMRGWIREEQNGSKKPLRNSTRKRKSKSTSKSKNSVSIPS